MATQNPIEQEGTYPLPEAQVDRFLLKVVITFPSVAEERVIIDVAGSLDTPVLIRPVVEDHEIIHARHVVNTIYMDEKIKDYIVSLVYATRNPVAYKLDIAPYIKLGSSPRATLGLVSCSKAMAFLNGRGYVTPQDVKTIAMDVMRHRISVTYEAEAESIGGEDLIQRILDTVPVP